MNKHDITISAIALILARLISPALNLVLMAVMAKSFGSDLVGGYYLPLAWLTIFQGFAALGVGDVVAREVARFPDRAQRCFASGLLLGLSSSVISSIFMVGLAQLFHYPSEIEASIRLLSLSLPPIALVLVCEGLYIACHKTKYLVFVSFFETFVSVSLNLVLLYRGCGVVSLMGVVVAARVVSAGAHLMIVHRKFSPLRFDWDVALLRSLIPPTVVFGLSKILGLIVLKADVIILSKLQTIGEVGLYVAAVKLMEVWLMLPHAFGYSAFPILAREFDRSRDRTLDILVHTTRRLFTVAVPIVIGMILFSREIVLVCYGRSFASAATIVQLLMLAFLLMCGDILLGNTCRAVGRQNFDLGILSVNAVANVALNFLLIPRYGLKGACYATILSMSLSVACRYYYIHRRIFQPGWGPVVLKPFALVTPAALAVLLFRNQINPLVLGTTFLGAYSLGLFLTKGDLLSQP